MQSLKKFYFGKQKAKVNTFIGGIGGTINTPALLAAKLGISENRIKLFKVTGVDVECAIVGGGYIPPYAGFNNDSALTYFNDKDGLIVTMEGRFIRYCSNLLYVNFPNLDTIDEETFILSNKMTELNAPKLRIIKGYFSSVFGLPLIKSLYLPLLQESYCSQSGTANYQFNNMSSLNRLYVPNMYKLGITNLKEGSILNNSNLLNLKIYANPILQTSNAGAEEGDIAYARSQGATIRYVTNFTPPNPVINLSAGTIYNTAVQLNFTPPTSVNGVDFYECYANGKLMNEIKSSGDYITGLTPSTNYNIRIVAVDMFYNKSELSNTLNVSTTSNLSDTDATAYTTASSNIAYQYAINDLFKGLKDNSLYTKIQAFYPFLGTTQAQHKWNAKNPLDTNAAFRLQFFGGGTHSNLGYQCNGTNAYANTFLIPSAVQNVNSNGLTVAVGTNNSVVGSASEEMGAYNSDTSCSVLTSKENNTNFNRIASFNNNTIGVRVLKQGINEARGIFTGTKTTSNVHKLIRNSTILGTGAGSGALPTVPIWIGALNINNTIYGPSSQRIQFTAIHEGLTDAEVVALHTIIDNFESAIGRKTW